MQPRNRLLRDLLAARLDVLKSLKRLQVNSIECLIIISNIVCLSIIIIYQSNILLIRDFGHYKWTLMDV